MSTTPALPCPIDLELQEVAESPAGERRHAWGPGGLWVWTPVRHRPHYRCSAGTVHDHWWRLHQPGGGYAIERRCEEHEVRLRPAAGGVRRITW